MCIRNHNKLVGKQRQQQQQKSHWKTRMALHIQWLGRVCVFSESKSWDIWCSVCAFEILEKENHHRRRRRKMHRFLGVLWEKEEKKRKVIRTSTTGWQWIHAPTTDGWTSFGGAFDYIHWNANAILMDVRMFIDVGALCLCRRCYAMRVLLFD